MAICESPSIVGFITVRPKIMRSCYQLLFIVGICLCGNAFAQTTGNCNGTPPDAVIELPAPLSLWGQIGCTPYGHILTNKDGWVWTYPGSYAPVFVPSQMVKDKPVEVGNKSYFKSIKMTKVEGIEFQKAYAAFHDGLDPKETIPVGYRLDITSISDRAARLYFFDYGDHAAGIWCNQQCEPKSWFMLLDMAHRPSNSLKSNSTP